MALFPTTPHGALLQDFQSLRYIDGLPSSFQFFLPLGAGGALHLPPAAFLPPSKEKRLPPELPLPKQLVCRWSKVSGERWGGAMGGGGMGLGGGACGNFVGPGVVMGGWETMQGHCEDGGDGREGHTGAFWGWGEGGGLEGGGRVLWGLGGRYEAGGGKWGQLRAGVGLMGSWGPCRGSGGLIWGSGSRGDALWGWGW